MKRYEDTSPLRDISQHILDILEFDVLPDCSGSNWIHLEDIRQNEQLGSQVYISETAIAWARLRKAAADAMKKSKYEGFEVQELYIHFSFRLCYPRCCIFFLRNLYKKGTHLSFMLLANCLVEALLIQSSQACYQLRLASLHVPWHI